MAGPVGRWIRRHDPELAALHKAVKVAVVVTAGLAIGTLLIGDSQLSTFAVFGGVALLLFADFPGSRSARLAAYLLLVGVGAILIVIGTLLSPVGWAAVVGMAVFGFLILFSGVFSAATAAATRAALLAFILPVTVRASAGEIPERLAGWAIAAAMAVPAAVFVWPPRDHDALRARAADACRALADQLASCAAPGPAPQAAEGATTAEAMVAIDGLRQQFRSTTFRPVGLTTGSRLLGQLVDQLGWLAAIAHRIPVRGGDRWPLDTRRLVLACADALEAAAATLVAQRARSSDPERGRLEAALTELERVRRMVVDSLDLHPVGVPGPDGRSRQATVEQEEEFAAGQLGGLLPAVVHELVYTTRLCARTVSAAAAADARPLLDRLLGRHVPITVDGSIAVAGKIAARHITRRSVWFQNSIRGAAGLAIAVLLAEVTDIAHGFWIVLGTMSVLRTSALTTGSTALRAMWGTVLGFLVGGGLVILLGTSPGPLWAVLPFVVLVAAFLPTAVSFVAGQAAFTVMVVILFNIIEPVGWRVGLVRIEDIALGCAAGLVCGVLLWPRGASAQIHRTLAAGYRTSAAALVAATGHAVGRPVGDTGSAPEALAAARAATGRLDDALREYLAERGSRPVPLRELSMASNGVNRLRLAAEALGGMAAVPEPERSTDSAAPLSTVRGVLVDCASATARWYSATASVLDGAVDPVPDPQSEQAERAVLTVLARDPDVVADPVAAAAARGLWGIALYIDDVVRLEARVVDAIRELRPRAAAVRRSRRPPAAPS